MKDKIGHLLKDGLVYGVAFSLQSLLAIILLPILTDYYSPDQFGVYNIIILVSIILGAIFYFGASSALGRFYYDEDSNFFRKQIVSSSLLVSLIGAIILIAIGYFSQNYISKLLFDTNLYSKEIFLSLTATSFNFLVGVFSLLVRYLKKPLFFLIITIVGALLNFSITYILLEFFGYDIIAPIIGQLVANILLFLALLIKYFNFLTVNINQFYIKKIFSFGLPIAFASLVYYFVDGVDRFLIKDLLDIKQVGIYALAYSLGRIINVVLVSPFGMVWAPLRMEYFNDKNTDAKTFKDFSKLVTSYYTIFGVTLIIFLTLFGENLLKLFFSNQAYFDGFKILPIILFSFFLLGYQNILDFGIYQTNRSKFYLIISIFSLIINISLNLWLIPIYGIFAAAFTTMITYLFNVITVYLISMRYYKMSIDFNRILNPIIILSLTYYLLLIYNLSLILKSLIFTLFLFWLIKFWLFSNEKLLLKNYSKLVFKKFKL